MKRLVTVLGLLVSCFAFAHEGHDHGPGSLQAPKGGVLRSLETVHLELKADKNILRIYAYELDAGSQKLSPTEVSKFPVSAILVLPRNKSEPLALKAQKDHWEAAFDAKGAHRYTVELKIAQGGHNDKVKFTVEPRK